MTAFGTVTSYDTGDPIRPATAAEWRRTAGRLSEPGDGYTGTWTDEDGRAVYVDGGPDAGVTDEDIAALRVEAGEAGDYAQARICDIALGDRDPGELAELIDGMEPWMGDQDAMRAMTPQEARAGCAAAILDTRAEFARDEQLNADAE